MESKEIGRILKNTGPMDEHAAKRLLFNFGVPVAEEILVRSADEAADAAKSIGFPVVLKGWGPNLLHKTEHGLVFLNQNDTESVRKSAEAILSSGLRQVEGILVQKQVKGSREFLAGMFKDPQFGPVIIFGLGGIFTEVLKDISLKLAPINRNDAENMLDEITSKALLGPFRGEEAVRREQIIDVLLAISRISTENQNIKEIDINPLKVTPDGSVLAVDALVFTEAEKELSSFKGPVDPSLLGAFFHPKSIAFVGASSQFGKWGHMLFTLTKSGGYRGRIFLVNRKGGKIAGHHVYTSVTEIEEKVDLAVVTIPAAAVLALLEEFALKKIDKVLLITSGFGETGANGKKLEKRLVEEATKAGIMIIGPNTMGICNPHINLFCTGSHVRPIPGSTAMVAQSGNMGTQLLAFAERQGIGIRGFCGSGNEAMITIEDYIEAFEDDDKTKTVMLYVESVKDGRRFFNSCRRIGKKKPIALLKGGRTSAGYKAAASHTGAMSTDNAIFDAMCRQAGIIQVDHPMDLLDLSAAFSSLPLPRGNRVAIMTLGGGWGVVTADLCSTYGLAVPDLSDDLIKSFDEILPEYWSRSNPVDIVGENDPLIPMIVMESLMKWDGCDAVINLGIIGRSILLKRLTESTQKADPTYDKDFLISIRKALKDFESEYMKKICGLMERFDKPVFGVSLLPDRFEKTVFPQDGFRFKGVFYPSPERAVKAAAKMAEYYNFSRQQ